ncbi:YdcF family protein [Psychrobacter frigidicola]|uniref:YdcF family protein n=1 Tax=Psychrobacter frigidicola TaxID=45611 RepID=A0A5C7A5P6_9GAMM|nr:YdcF family protein [Psychrobacter frigidicola]TXD97995.1 YdcF family protein [Psychrobacter frigidicola]
MGSKRLLSKRLWRYYLRSAERTIKVFRIINIIFVVGSTLIIVVLVSLFTPLFSRAVIYIFQHLPLPTMTGAAVSSPPTAYVILGGGLTNDNDNHTILNDYSLNRVRTAAAAYHDLPLPVVLSGAEAPWLGQWLIEHGIDGIISENASMNTCENARFTAKRIPLHHVYLITDSYHMTRARRQFALNNINTTPIDAELPVKRDWLEPAQNLSHSRRAVYEIAAYLRDVLRPQSNCRHANEVSQEQLLTPRGKAVKTFD